jgi:hypothetical protein
MPRRARYLTRVCAALPPLLSDGGESRAALRKGISLAQWNELNRMDDEEGVV